MTKLESRRSGVTRRAFLKTTALTAGALASAGVVGCSSVSTEAPVDGTQHVEEKVLTGSCRGNCGGFCMHDVKLREGKIVSTMPKVVPGREEVTTGCVRGVSNIARIYGTGRTMYPLKRVEGSERGAGEWERISWDEAFALVAEKFQAAIDDYGGQAIGIWQGAGSGGLVTPLGAGRFAQKFGCTKLGYMHDWAGMYMKWFALSIPDPVAEDLQYAKTIVLWGSNPAVAGNNRKVWYWMCKARENGAKFITVDPLYTETAAQSDKWLPVRIGTDGALMCAMINYIVDNELYDEGSLKNKSVAPFLIKEDGSYLRQSDMGMEVGKNEKGEDDDQPLVWDNAAQAFVSHKEATDPAYKGAFDADGVPVRTVFDESMESIAPFDLDYAVNECGLPAEDIIELAELCLEGMPTYLYIDWGLEHTYNCFHVYYNISLLASLIGCTGAVQGSGYSSVNASASTIWKQPVKLDNTVATLENALPSKSMAGEYMVEIMETGKWAGEDLTFEALFIHGISPLDNCIAPLEIIKAWDKIGFVVTADPLMTTSAQYSDLVLPATFILEHEDFIDQGTARLRETRLQLKVIEPAGDAKPDYDIWCGIAAAMGIDDLYPMTAEECLHSFLDTPENIEAGVAYDDYAAAGGAIQGEYVYSEDPVSFNAFGMPNVPPFGRTAFYLEKFTPRQQFGQTIETHDRLPYYKPAKEAYLDNPERDKYPLFGFSNHDIYHGQSLHAHSPWLDQFRKVDGSPYCRIHETVAAERGIATGDAVRCYNAHGSVVLNAVVTKGIREDSVWLPHGFFCDEFIDGFAQSLIGYHPDPQTSNANFNDMILQVEKYEGSAE